MPRKRVRLNVPKHLREYEKTRVTPTAPVVESHTAAELLEAQLERLRCELDDLTDKHHDALYRAIAHRYHMSREVAREPALLEAISALAKTTVTPESAIRYYFKLSVKDPKKASKYYRRVKPIWDAGGLKEEVYEFLKKEGLEKKHDPSRGQAEAAQHGERHSGTWTITDRRGQKIRIDVATERRSLTKLAIKRQA